MIKKLHVFTAFIAMLVLTVYTGCKTTQSANVRVAVSVGGSIILAQLPASEKATVAKYIYTAAEAIRTIDPANPPSSADFKKLISQFVTSDSAAYVQIANVVSGIYTSQVASKLGAGAKTNLALLEELATELENMAAPYVSKPSASIRIFEPTHIYLFRNHWNQLRLYMRDVLPSCYEKRPELFA